MRFRQQRKLWCVSTKVFFFTWYNEETPNWYMLGNWIGVLFFRGFTFVIHIISKLLKLIKKNLRWCYYDIWLRYVKKLNFWLIWFGDFVIIIGFLSNSISLDNDIYFILFNHLIKIIFWWILESTFFCFFDGNLKQ